METIIYKQSERGYRQQRDENGTNGAGSGGWATGPGVVSPQLGQLEWLSACPTYHDDPTGLFCCAHAHDGSHANGGPLEVHPAAGGGEETQSHQSVPRYLPAVPSSGFLPVSNKEPVSAPHICSSKAMESPDGLCCLS